MTAQIVGGWQNPWTDEKVAALKELWPEGYSCAQIARVLGCGISRNAVIGKVRRLGLEFRVPGGGRPVSSKTRTPRATPTAPEIPKPPAVPLGIKPVALERVGYGQCRFPLWDTNGAPDYLVCANFCGAEVYCDHHRAIVFQPASSMRARNRQAEKTEAA